MSIKAKRLIEILEQHVKDHGDQVEVGYDGGLGRIHEDQIRLEEFSDGLLMIALNY